MEFVDEMEFDRLGVFTYSPEEEYTGSRDGRQVPEEVKEERGRAHGTSAGDFF